MRLRFTLLRLLIIPMLFLMGCSSGDGDSDGGSAATLEKIQVEPFQATLDMGTSQQYTATAIYTNGDKKDVTDVVTWSSSEPTVASIDEKGIASARLEGPTVIAALIGTIHGMAQLQVEDKTVSTIEVYPSEAAAIVTITRQFTAIANFSDNTYQDITKDVIWNSSETNIASVSNDYANAGEATANSQGLADMGATFDGNDGTSLFAVLNAQPKEINVVPFNTAIPKGTYQQFAATLILDNNEKIPITDDVLWSSSDSEIASISNAHGSNGLASGNDLGTVSITATLTFADESYSASATLTITAATPTSLQVTPAEKTLSKGTTGHYTATAYYIDDSSRDVTKEATWESSNADVVHITTSGKNAGYAQALESGKSTITAYFEGQNNSTGVTVAVSTLESIQVSPVNENVAKGLNVQYSAIGIYSDNTKEDLTQHATWQSSDTAVAAIDRNGEAYGIDVGDTTISASFGGLSASTTLTVTAAIPTALQVTPDDKTVPKGAAGYFTATVYYTDDSSRDVTKESTWESSNTDVVHISSSGQNAGYAQALEGGTSTITAYFEGQNDSTGIIVTTSTLESIQVSPVNESVAKGLNVQYSAIGIFSDNTKADLTQHATWKSSNTPVATVDSGGQAHGVDVGETTISAFFGGLSASTTLTVTAATVTSLQVTPADKTVPKGATEHYTATVYYTDDSTRDVTKEATWESSNTDVAHITTSGENAGYVRALDGGKSTITAYFEGQSNSTGVTVTTATLESIQVTPVNESIAKGLDVQYSAIGIYSDSTKTDLTQHATWQSSDTAVATIDSDGAAYGVDVGDTTISAFFGGLSASTTLTVTAATPTSLQVTPPDESVPKGTTGHYTATVYYSGNSSRDVTKESTWESSNTDVAYITTSGENAGYGEALESGTSTITAHFEGKNDSTGVTVTTATLESIQVTPVNESIAKGLDVQYSAIGIYSDNTKVDLTQHATWQSSDTAVATIDSDGKAHGVDVGSATISASFEGHSNSADLTVTAATPTSLQVTPADKTVPKGATEHYTATVYYTDDSTRDVTKDATWESSNTDVAHITTSGENAGYVRALEGGTSTITAYFEGQNDSTTITVTAATLESIQVTPVNESIAKGLNVQYSAIGIYSDNTKVDLTLEVAWKSSNTAVATIDSDGRAHGVDVGSATISAPFEGHSDSTDLTVTAATPTSLQVIPVDKTVPKGATGYYTATAYYTDDSTRDVTQESTWESSNTAVAYITTSGENAGYAEALESGTSTIASYFEGKSDSTGVTVTAATLESIQVTPVNESIAKGLDVQYSAIGIYSDNTKVDLTLEAAWKSSNRTVATIDSDGKAHGVDEGSATISAPFEGQSDSTDLTVLPKKLSSIQLTTDEENIHAGSSTQMQATGIYSDNTNKDITKQVTWTSSDKSVAIVHNDAGNEGLVEGLIAGNTDISAELDGIASTMRITVTAITLDHINIHGPRYVVVKTEGQYDAEGIYSDGSSKNITTEVFWKVTPQSVATISNANGSQGKLTGLGVGQATVAASVDDVSDQYQMDVTEPSLESIVVTPANSTIHRGAWIQFTATGHYSNGFEEDITTSALWQSSDNTKIYLYNVSGYEGYGVANLPGTVTISAISGVLVGNTQLTIIARTLQSIDISPLNATVDVGTHLQYTATGNYSDGSTEDLTSEATWIARPTNTKVVSITQDGLLRGRRVGNADIDATLDTVTGTTPVTVEEASLISIEVTPADTTLKVNKKKKYTATGHFSDGTTQKISKDVVWESSDENVASFEKKGNKVKAHNVGVTTISASMEGISGNTSLTVTD